MTRARDVVAYYSSESTRGIGTMTEATMLQRAAVREWATERWNISRELLDNYTGVGTRDHLPGLDEAIAHCRHTGAMLVYVKLQLWRPNPVIKAKVRAFETSGGNVFEIPTHPDYGAAEVVRYLGERRRIAQAAAELRRRTRKLRERDPAGYAAARKLGGLARASLINERLYSVALNIRESMQVGHTNAETARYLNACGKISPQGREWTPEMVRKAKKKIMHPSFLEDTKSRRDQIDEEILATRKSLSAWLNRGRWVQPHNSLWTSAAHPTQQVFGANPEACLD